MGTGIVIDPRGYILTNYHVVEGVSKIQVTLADGETADRPPRLARPQDRPGDHQDRRQRAAARDPLRHLVRPDERRAGDRHRQRLRLRAHGHPRHHQRPAPQRAGQRRAEIQRPDPDRRQHQPRQLRRPAAEHRRRGDRHQRRRPRRGPGHRLCHSDRRSPRSRRPPDEHRAARADDARHRRQDGLRARAADSSSSPASASDSPAGKAGLQSGRHRSPRSATRKIERTLDVELALLGPQGRRGDRTRSACATASRSPPRWP